MARRCEQRSAAVYRFRPLVQAFPGVMGMVNTLTGNNPISRCGALSGVKVRVVESCMLQGRETLVKSRNWKHPNATAPTVRTENWLGAGNQTRMLRGRKQEIVASLTGESDWRKGAAHRTGTGHCH